MFVPFIAIFVGVTLSPSVVYVFTSHCVDLVMLWGVLVRCPSDMFLPSGLIEQDTLACDAPRGWPIAGYVARSQHPVHFSDGIPDVEHGHLYESANAGSDRRDFSVARSIDVIAVVMLYVPLPRGGTDAAIAAGVSVSVRAAKEDKGAVLAREVPGPSEGCRAAKISLGVECHSKVE